MFQIMSPKLLRNHISEKIRLLRLLPESYNKYHILDFFPEVTLHMCDRAGRFVEIKAIYSEPDIYSGHRSDQKNKERALKYYLNDDLDCSSSNTRDMITLEKNNENS